MTDQSATSLATEFELDPFAEYYDELSDSFIDIHRASKSLAALLPSGATTFEIGLGTGYFAQQLASLGFDVCGIQPKDRMLDRLKSLRPNIKLLGETTLEQYVFDRQYDVIVSHSSVFLFTKHYTEFGPNGETRLDLVFQSFLKAKLEVYFNLFKVLVALSPKGRFFVNVQNNPLPIVEVGPAHDRLRFEMAKCTYDLRTGLVEKLFKATYRKHAYVIRDERYCCTYTELASRLQAVGVLCSLSEENDWVIFSKAARRPFEQ